MAKTKQSALGAARETKLQDAMEILRALGFTAKQTNAVAGYSLLALLDLKPVQRWIEAASPLCGITPIMEFVNREYARNYKPNTREGFRDDAVKYFVEAGMVIKNPDDPARPVTSDETVYQVERTALELFRLFGTLEWSGKLKSYLSALDSVRMQLRRQRELSRIPVNLPSGKTVSISPGGQNPLIKTVVEEFCPRFVPGGTVVYIGDAEDKFLHLDTPYLLRLGVIIPASAKMPDVVVHDTMRNWLLLIETVTSAGPVDQKRRRELKELFAGCNAGLVFVTAFSTRKVMRTFSTQISWETEVWIAEDPEHLIHFNGERFLGPYPDVMPKAG